MKIVGSFKRWMTFGFNEEQEDCFRQANLSIDIGQTRICLRFILVAMMVFVLNDYHFFGFSLVFYVITAMRSALLIYTILLYKSLRRITKYRAYDRKEFTWGLIFAVFVIAVAATRPDAFIAHVIVTIIAVFVSILAIPNRFINQFILSLLYTIGETVIIAPSLKTATQASITALISLWLANAVAVICGWQLQSGRRTEHLAREKAQKAETEAEQRLIYLRKTEEALRESELRYRNLIKHAPAGIYEIDLETFRFIEVNDIMCHLLGYNRGQILSMKADELLDEEGRKQFMERMSRLLAGERISDHPEYRVRTKDGRQLWGVLNVTVNYNDEKPRSLSVVAHDITEHKRAEEALRESEQRLRSVTENMSEGLMLFDPQVNLIYQNAASLRIHGYPVGEDGRIAHEDLPVTWQVWDDQGRPITFDQWPVSRVFRGERFQNQVLHVLCPGTGLEFDASYNGCPIYDAAGKLVFGFITIRDITEQRKTVAALRGSEGRFRALTETSALAVGVSSSDGKILYINKAYEKLFGYTLEELKHVNASELWYHPEYRHKMIDDVGFKGFLMDYEVELKRKDGTPFWAMLSVNSVDYGGKQAIMASVYDITGRKAAAEVLRESEERFRALAEALPSIAWTADAQGGLDYLSKRWYEYTGQDIDKGMGWGWDVVTHPEDLAQTVEKWKGAVKAKSVFENEVRVRRYDGEYRWFLVRAWPLLGADGNVVRWFGTNTDVHDLRQAREIQQQLAQQRQIALEAARLGWWHYNPITRMATWDERYKEIFGVTGYQRPNDDILARIIHPDDLAGLWAKVEAALDPADPKPYAAEYRIIRPDGALRWIEAYGVAKFEGEGDGRKAVSLVGTVSDVTDRKAAAEVLKRDKETFERLVQERTSQLVEIQVELERAKHLSDIGVLSAIVAHELRNPLAAIQMAAHNIKRKTNNPDLDKHLANIEKKVGECDQIINNLLFYSRIKPPHYESINIFDIIEDSIEHAHQHTQKEITVFKTLDFIKGVCIDADPLQIKEVFNNILNNALDALPPKMGEIRVMAENESGFLVVSIEDNGSGIEQDICKQIFDPFFTTKAKGTGLGLAVCRQIINMHKGEIGVRSEPGQGTTVIIRLPMKERQCVPCKS